MTAQTSLIGQTIGQYKIISEIGRGGMGVVYLANQESVDREVAVKILATHLVEDESFVKRFVQEGRIAAALNHPNIVTVHEIGQEGGNFFIAMEAVHGKSISALLQKSGKLPLKNALEITRQAAEALSSAHEKGVIHRDIKPENIMLDERDRVKLMDFGLAKAIAGAGNLTATGTLLGTPKYMSPEQCTSGTLGPPSDIYSLGVVLYEMLSGQLPYESDTPLGLMIKIAQEPFPRLPGVNVTIPPSVERIVRNMTARAQENRYASGRALVRDLEACLKDPNAPIQSTWTTGEDEGVQDLGLGQDLVAGLMDTGEKKKAPPPAARTPSMAGGRRILPVALTIVAVAALAAGAFSLLPRQSGGNAAGGRNPLEGVRIQSATGPGDTLWNGGGFDDGVGSRRVWQNNRGTTTQMQIMESVEHNGETFNRQEYFSTTAEGVTGNSDSFWILRGDAMYWYFELGDTYPRASIRYPLREGDRWTESVYLTEADREAQQPTVVNIRVSREEAFVFPPGTARLDIVVDSLMRSGTQNYDNPTIRYWWTPYLGIIQTTTSVPGQEILTNKMVSMEFRGRTIDLDHVYATGEIVFL